jgi:outer membrane lipoprotein-sorting protein
MTLHALDLIVVRVLVPAAVLVGLALPSAVQAQPSPDDVLTKANAIIAPEAYLATIQMVAVHSDGTTRTYVFKTMKQGSDKLRLSFYEPKTLSGHELLRLGDDLWRYVPSLKRSMRIASRDDFEAGDFRNADVLRVDLVHDYRVTGMKDAGDTWILDLIASTKQAGYDRIVYTVRKSDAMPLQQEFYAASGKKLRSATFLDPVSFGKHVRPSKVKMVNELTRGQSTDMTVQSFELVDSIPPRTFQRESLGR